MIITVTAEENGKELESVLRSRGFSRRLITRLKRTENGMTCKGRLIRTVDHVACGDNIVINEGRSEALEANPELKAEILFEDEETVVFSKPPHMPCHPSIKHQGDTLGNLFAALYPELAFRPVNRLDRDTSGCVLAAKSQRAAYALQKCFEKTYIGATPRLPFSGGRICAPIAREKESIIKRCIRDDGQYAATDLRVTESTDRVSFVEFQLETGRTHQIRIHMAHIGFPLLGDDLYGGDKTLIGRQALHCSKIAFISPASGEHITVYAPLPDDMLKLKT